MVKLVKNKFQLGDKVTISEPGYYPQEDTIVNFFTNRHGVHCAKLKSGEEYPLSSLILSKKSDLDNLTRSDVLSIKFLSTLEYDDSVWCNKVKYPRTDADPGIENIVGAEAFIAKTYDGKYRINITYSISKHHHITSDSIDEKLGSLSEDIVNEAISILKDADKVYVNYGKYLKVV